MAEGLLDFGLVVLDFLVLLLLEPVDVDFIIDFVDFDDFPLDLLLDFEALPVDGLGENFPLVS